MWAARVQSATRQGGVPKRAVRAAQGEEMQEARDGRLKIVDRATRDVHSVAWMLRRAVGRAGAERNAAGRRAQACGAGSQEGQEACRRPDGRLNRGTRDGYTSSAMDAVWCWDRGLGARRGG